MLVLEDYNLKWFSLVNIVRNLHLTKKQFLVGYILSKKKIHHLTSTFHLVWKLNDIVERRIRRE